MQIGLLMVWSVFTRAIATCEKNKSGISLFFQVVKSGQKPSLTKPGSGWKEWADEATKRRLGVFAIPGRGHFGAFR